MSVSALLRRVVAIPLLIAAGLASRRVLGGLPAKLAGDALYTALVFALVLALRPRTRTSRAAALALAISCAVELLQLTGVPADLAARHRLFRLALGTTFGVIDLLGYLIGATLCALMHALLRPPRLFFLLRPGAATIRARIAAPDTLVCPPVLHRDAQACPPGYLRLFAEATVPGGSFARARTCILHFRHYPAFTTVHDTREPASRDARYAVVVDHLGVHSLNMFAITDIVDTPTKFALTLGTLHAHAEAGEERFAVEQRDGALHLSITSYSRTRHPLARLGTLYARHLQRRFLAEAMANLERAAR